MVCMTAGEADDAFLRCLGLITAVQGGKTLSQEHLTKNKRCVLACLALPCLGTGRAMARAPVASTRSLTTTQASVASQI